MTTVTTIPAVSSGYRELGYSKDYGYSYNNAIAGDDLVTGDRLTLYSEGDNIIQSSSDIVAVWTLLLDPVVTVTIDSIGVVTLHSEGVASPLATTISGYKCGAVFDYNGPVVVLSSSSGCYMCNGTELVAIDTMPTVDSMTSHFGRIYGIEGRRLHYCKLVDITNWEHSLYEGGYIDLPSSIGVCHTIISRGDYIYCMGSGGIAKLYAKSDPQQFTLDIMSVDMSPVCKGTAVLCGDNIWWLSTDGSVYQLDGTDREQMLTLRDNNVYHYDSTLASGYYEGRYVVPISVTYPDHKRIGCQRIAHANNTLLVVDTIQSSYQLIRGVDATAVMATNKLAVCVNGSSNLYTLGANSVNSYWQSDRLQLCGQQYKRIDSIAIDSQCPVTIVVASGKQSRQYYVDAGLRRLRVGMRGQWFYVGVSHSGSSMRVSPLGVYYTAFGTDKTGGKL